MKTRENKSIEISFNYSVNVDIILKVKNQSKINSINLTLYNYQNINNTIKDLISKNNISIDDSYYLYLERNNKIIKEINKDQRVDEIGIEDKDRIIITNDKTKEKKVEKQVIIDRKSEEEELKSYNNEKISLKNKENKNLDDYLENKSNFEEKLIKEKPSQNNIEKNKKNKKLYMIIITIILLLLLLLATGIYYFYIFITQRKNLQKKI